MNDADSCSESQLQSRQFVHERSQGGAGGIETTLASRYCTLDCRAKVETVRKILTTSTMIYPHVCQNRNIREIFPLMNYSGWRVTFTTTTDLPVPQVMPACRRNDRRVLRSPQIPTIKDWLGTMYQVQYCNMNAGIKLSLILVLYGFYTCTGYHGHWL